MPESGERRISTPLVLAASSAMLTLAVVVWLGLEDPPEAPTHEAREPNDLHVDDRTPETAAQSYYDAWRRRRWGAASEVSIGRAREQALSKQRADEALPHDERVIAERTWDALARAPLSLLLDQVDIDDEGRFHLAGTAEYLFVNQPYRRRVEFDVVERAEGYRVAQMELGEVLTDLPEPFRGGEAP